ncbi:MAG: vWA domain-containing protein [Planctomycetota bacterium]|jgi:Ca-activated chloride channel family protein
MIHFRFQDPFWFFLLIPLVLAVLFAVQRQRRSAVLYSSIQVLKTLPRSMALHVKRILPWVRFLGLALVILALSRPQQGREEFRVRTEGVAMEMVLDWSDSMVASDFELEGEKVSRLEAVKKVFRDFVAGTGDLAGRPDDLIGLVVFGGYPISKCPLTLDHGALLQILDTVSIPVPRLNRFGQISIDRLLEEDRATAIGDSVTLGVQRLKDVVAKSKVLILLSDGENTAGVIDPADAAVAAAEFGVKVYAIGVGTTSMRIPIRCIDSFGQTLFKPIPGSSFRLDEKALKMLAEKTGGRYWHASDTETLKEIYAEIDELEKTETEGRLYTEYKEFYQYALYPGLILVLLELLLSATRFRSLP